MILVIYGDIMLFYYFENSTDFFKAWQFMKGQRTSFILVPSNFILINLESYDNYLEGSVSYKDKVPEEILAKLKPGVLQGVQKYLS